MKVDLVFEGGGILGIAFVGAFEALTKKGYIVERCAGTSAGSIISSLIAAGYTYEELKEIINNTDFVIFMQKTSLSKIPLIGKLLSLIFLKGIYRIEVVEEWIKSLLAKKNVYTFKDIKRGSLKIVAADITSRKLLIFPDDCHFYGIKPDDFPISKAVAMSCSIPLFFTPIKMNLNQNINYVVDGGLVSTYPIWIFDIEKAPKYPVLGFKIKDQISFSSQGKTGLISYIKDLLNAAINKEETKFIRDEDLVRTIEILVDNKIKSIDFDINRQKLYDLCQSGFDSTTTFLRNYRFLEYIKRYYR